MIFYVPMLNMNMLYALLFFQYVNESICPHFCRYFYLKSNRNAF